MTKICIGNAVFAFLFAPNIILPFMNNEMQIYRVIDANLNRLREGLRVCEEYFRFVINEKEETLCLKTMRHLCKDLQNAFEYEKLLLARDSVNDPLASGLQAKENERENAGEILAANIKRCQEAARVIEEFAKLCPQKENAAKTAKDIRFGLYSFEKETLCR